MSARQLLVQASLMRPSAAMRIFNQLWMMHGFLLNNLPGHYLGNVSMQVLSRGLSIVALAGSIKIAAVNLFDWTMAIQFGERVGLPLQSTKTEIAMASAALIMALYVLYAITIRMRETLRCDFAGQCEFEILRVLLSDEVCQRISADNKLRSKLQSKARTYQQSTVRFVNAVSFTLLSIFITLVLGLYLPVLLAFFAILLLPILLIYLLTGRRMALAEQELDKLKGAQPLEKLIMLEHVGLGNERHAHPREQALDEMKAYISKKSRIESARSAPEFIATLITGAALALTLLFLSAVESQPQNIIYLLIGFILVRVLFDFVQKSMANFQVIMQNFESIRVVNKMIFGGRKRGHSLDDLISHDRSNEPRSSEA